MIESSLENFDTNLVLTPTETLVQNVITITPLIIILHIMIVIDIPMSNIKLQPRISLDFRKLATSINMFGTSSKIQDNSLFVKINSYLSSNYKLPF